MKTIAVDFDGVIHAYSLGWQDGRIYDEPVPGAFSAIEQLLHDYAVIIFTTRSPIQVADWLSGHGFPVTVCNPDSEFWNDQTQILVTNRKYPAFAYIDDRGIRFTSWDQALSDLKVIDGSS